MMTEDQRGAVRQMLGLWWLADRRGLCAGMGYPSECPSTRGYRAGYRGGDAEAESHELADILRAISRAVDGLPSDQALCAGAIGQAEATGAAVWRNPRLPDDPGLIAALERATLDALAMALCRDPEVV